MSVRSLVIAGCIAISIGFAIAVGASLSALSSLRIEGPIYNDLKRDFDLLADILPPPEYVIEAYLEATVAKQDVAANSPIHVTKLAQLRRDYLDRKKYWSEQPLAPNIRGLLLNSSAQVDAFWDIVDRKFLPGIARNDRPQIESAYEQLSSAYYLHRQAIDKLVTAAGARASLHQQGAVKMNAVYSRVVWISISVVALLMLGVAMSLINRVMKPLIRIAAVTRSLADGNLEAEVPGLGRTDELGELARAVDIFKCSAIAERAGNASSVAGMVARIATAFQRLSDGDLTVRIAEPFPEEFEKLRQDFNETVARLDYGITQEREKAACATFAVAQLTQGFQRLSDGDFSARLSGEFAADFERLRTDFNQTVSNLEEKILAEREAARGNVQTVTSLASGLKELSEGNLEARLDRELPGEYRAVGVAFNGTVAHLQRTVQTINGCVGGVKTGANQISHASADLAKRTERQAASLEETAAALEEITATVKQTAVSATEVRDITANANSAALEGCQIVESAINAMTRIEQSSRNIADITSVIDEISFQTNLLALNAGIEAARAGDSGRGFAVVASEVRALAQRSGEAAREIRKLIEATGQQISTGVVLVDDSGKALSVIMQHIKTIDGLVGTMTTAVHQQSTGVEEVNLAVSQMDQVTQQNAAMVEESNAAALSLADEAEELTRLMSHFRVGVGPDREAAGNTSMRVRAA